MTDVTIHTGTLSGRRPAHAVMHACLRAAEGAEPPGRLARLLGAHPLPEDARSWYTGALGERTVAAELDRLGGGWHVLHALPVGRGSADLDHLVVGPAGVFSINTKHSPGRRVWVGGRAVLVDGHRQHWLRAAEAEARHVRRALDPEDLTLVRPLIAVVGARLTVQEDPVEVRVLEARQLVRWLQRQPARLAPDAVERLAARAGDPAHWRAEREEQRGDPMPAFARLEEAVGAAERRRRGLTAAGSIALTGAVVSLPLWVQGLLALLR